MCTQSRVTPTRLYLHTANANKSAHHIVYSKWLLYDLETQNLKCSAVILHLHKEEANEKKIKTQGHEN
jgi:hypothetical protein